MSIETEDIDKGFKALIKELRKLDDNPYVKVGFTDPQEKHPEEGDSMLVIASSNEFGTGDGRIPERSFMRSTADEIRRDVMQMIDKGYDQIIKQKTTVESILKRIGIFVVGKTQEKIVNIDSPPNTQATIDAKGSSSPLQDQGYMKQSIRHEVKMRGE